MFDKYKLYPNWFRIHLYRWTKLIIEVVSKKQNISLTFSRARVSVNSQPPLDTSVHLYLCHIVCNICAQSSCVQLYCGAWFCGQQCSHRLRWGRRSCEDGSCRDQHTFQMWTLWLVSMSAKPAKLWLLVITMAEEEEHGGGEDLYDGWDVDNVDLDFKSGKGLPNWN